MLCIAAAGKRKRNAGSAIKIFTTLVSALCRSQEKDDTVENTGGGPYLPLSCTECASEFLNISHSASLWSNGIALVRLTADESEHFGNRKCRTSLRKESSDCLWQMFFCLNHTGFPHYKSDFVR